ncbi:MAG: sugar phosphate isomerase/epimerase family protein [Candidatus Promineifilaceae bacterium]
MGAVLMASDGRNLDAERALAEARGLGLELQAFADPVVLHERYAEALAAYGRCLSGFSGPLGLNGAFFDLNGASRDPAVRELSQRRHRQSLHAAAEIGASYVVFHLNYPAYLKVETLDSDWQARSAEYWGQLAAEAGRLDVTLLVENSIEPEPGPLRQLVGAVNSPELKVCLDVAHVSLYSPLALDHWLAELEPHLYCCHLNNHDGRSDRHWPLDRGVIEYRPVIERLRALAWPPLLCLELFGQAEIASSLTFLDKAGRG